MSRAPPARTPSTALPARRGRPRALTSSSPRAPPPARRPSVSGLALTGTINPVTGAPKAQRTSKTTQKLVLLPTAPQTKPLPPPLSGDEQDLQHGYETDTGVRDIKSAGERMSKEERKKAACKRMTAYCVCEGFKMKLLASFLKREHNVRPRVFDDAMYAMYHLPLLPGYGPGSNIRSSVPPPTNAVSDDTINIISEAEYGGYVSSLPASLAQGDGFVAPAPSSDYPIVDGTQRASTSAPSQEQLPPISSGIELNVTSLQSQYAQPSDARPLLQDDTKKDEEFAEAVFFSYGVVVFFGLEEGQEKGILEDVEAAGIARREMDEDKWEVEECHYTYDAYIAYPRIYNDFFTFKRHSQMQTLSIAHALAQSTLLALYETQTLTTLSSPQTMAIPQHLASTGSLKLSRTEALKITGRLFKLRRDVNLGGNVLDVPEIFWEEVDTGMRGVYDAVREYMEIGVRVNVLNEKLAVAEDLLGAIHDHLNNNAMERITWIIIWLIVVACLVEVGEVIARLVFHASKSNNTPGSEHPLTVIPPLILNTSEFSPSSVIQQQSYNDMSREELLQTIERLTQMMVQSDSY